ncbi:MAG: hypothetical protein LBL21_05360 [Rickettsiales bacterium]|jgi:hypothetical protein|nr:hypothetical protein [Rickettsiales bacterium]
MADGILDIYDLEKSAPSALFAKFMVGMFREWLKTGAMIVKTPNYLYPCYSFKMSINNYFATTSSDHEYTIYVTAEEKRGINHSVKINAGFVGGERKEICFADYPTKEGLSRAGSEIAKSVYDMTVRKYKAQQKVAAQR